MHAQLQFLQFVREQPSINEIDRRGPVASGLAPGFQGESARADDDALVCAPDHRSPKVTNSIGADVALVTLALKEDVKTDQTANANRAVTVDSTVSGALSNLHFDESRFAENTLAQAFRAIGSMA